jgi:aryl-alcohol dehydrogenase-like predicted oxidoreductase
LKYTSLGRSGLKVSRICLGCMGFGLAEREWGLTEEESRPIIRRAVEAGINFFDTANMYGEGASEEVTGRALAEYGRREELVIATKVHFPMREDPNARGLSRKSIMTEIDASLRRLGTDYVDLYQIHRWDPDTPVEETLEALHDVVKAGKARYIGASSMAAWQFCKALMLAEKNGWTRFISMQPHYNLIYREEEREMLPLCKAQGIGVIPWSPLARGRLARPWEAEPTTVRGRSDEFGARTYAAMVEVDRSIIGRLTAISEARGLPHAQIALGWLLSKTAVTAPIVGTTRLPQLEDALSALEVELTAEEVSALESDYVPHPVSGH